MKHKPVSKYWLAVLLFSFFVTGILAQNNQNAVTSSEEKKLEQTRDMRAERKLLWELRQLKKAEAAVPGADMNLRSKAEMEIRAKIRMLQSGKNLVDPQRLFGPEAQTSKTGRNVKIEKGLKPASYGGSISGRVTDTSGVGIANIGVFGYGGDSHDPVFFNGYTDASGNYTIGVTYSTWYWVYFDNMDQNYVSEYYPHEVMIFPGCTTANIDAQLATGGIVSGKVTDTLGVGIENIGVEVYDMDYHYIEGGGTDASGNYLVSGLPSGNVKVYFYHSGLNYASEWYNDKNNFAAADPVMVTSGGTTPNIDAQLAVPGSISGRVTNASGVGIYDIDVPVYDLNHNCVGWEYTDANGNYTISGLYAGNFKVEFYVYDGRGNALSEWYNDKGGFDTADPVAVIAGSTTANIDAQLATAGSISGRVTNSSGVGLAGVEVHAYELDGNNTYLDCETDANGYYTLSGLATGSYKLSFWRDYDTIYLSEWYNDKSSLDTADPVAVIAGSTTTNIDAQLATGGSIAGRVTNSSGVGIAGIRVLADWLADADTDANGYYSVAGLATGSYKVSFREFLQNKYVAEWYNDKSSYETADPVAVTAGSTTTDINAQLTSTGSISGRITNAAGVGIGNIYVKTYDLDNKPIYTGDKFTDANGNYTASWLAPGNIKVFFLASEYDHPELVSEWYNDKSSFATADPITVISGGTTPNIDARLDLVPVATGVHSPNGGENWNSGDIHDITWTYPDTVANVHIDYSINNGSSWLPVAADTANDGTYAWTVPSTPSTTCRVRVRDAVDNDPSDSSDNMFSISQSGAETVSTPSQPTGAASGLKDAFYSFLSGGSTSNLGHAVQYKFDWDNGTDSGWLPEGTTGASHAWTVNDTYHVRAMARCVTDTGIESLWSVTHAIVISSNYIVKVISPNGGENWNIGTIHSITWSSSGTFANVNIDYSTNNGSSWLSVAASTANDGTYAWTVPATLSPNCLLRVSDSSNAASNDISNSVFSISSSEAETISTPTQPSGANVGLKATSYAFTTGDSTSNLGHTVQYRIDWDDGTDSGWLAEGTNQASHSWAANGTYEVKAIARCVTHTTIESLWSETHAITISDSGTLGKYNSPAQQKILPEVIWSPATGGGTWMSEVQITDIRGGSQVSVYYNTTTGRSGPFLLWNNNSGGAFSSVKYSNLLQTIDGLDSGVFTYYGTVGAVEFISQDAAHVIQVTARTLNGNYSKTFPAFSLHDSNTAAIGRWLIIPNLTNNSAYRSFCGLYNPTADAVTVELRLFDSVNTQIGSTISKTMNGYDFVAFNPFVEANVPYPAYSYDNLILQVEPIAGTGKVFCFGASANNATNDPAAHIAVQNSNVHDNGPSSLKILPEAIWSPATGGGTWITEVQTVDTKGGAGVSVYFDYGSGNRRGPFELWSGSVAGSKVKYANILQQLGTIDTGFNYYGSIGTLEFHAKEGSDEIYVTARTLNGNNSKTFPGLNLVDAETADTSRVMLIQNLTNNSIYRSTCGFYNPTADSVTVEFTLLNGYGVQIGSQFSKTFVGYDFQAFNPFTEAGRAYPAYSNNNVILRVRPTSGTGKVICFGASANNTSNDPASHLAVQAQ